MSQPQRIAILGASGHIGKSLVAHYLSQAEPVQLHLFVRDRAKMRAFLAGLPAPPLPPRVEEFAAFPALEQELVVNCVGCGGPRALRENLADIFRLTAHFDDLVLAYLADHPRTLYLNLSSGAAHGSDFSQPMDERSPARFNLNNLQAEEFYGIAKLHSEAKHRARPELNIVDLRIFGYFSRYIELDEQFLLSEIIRAIKDRRPLPTAPEEMRRDFLHPQDLAALIACCLSHCPLNGAFNAYSGQEIGKFALLDFFAAQHGLEYTIAAAHHSPSVTGQKSHYYPTDRQAATLGYQPRHTSLTGIALESAALLGELASCA